ncbi:MAG: hypothetical protein OXH09_07450, partial [Gammaproteobacteria bacterium]|nr:hypothetical protein [Gammaproteobacteria bacterium]
MKRKTLLGLTSVVAAFAVGAPPICEFDSPTDGGANFAGSFYICDTGICTRQVHYVALDDYAAGLDNGDRCGLYWRGWAERPFGFDYTPKLGDPLFHLTIWSES